MLKHTAVAALALVVGAGITAAPAQADSGSFPDAARDAAVRGLDILQVKVANQADKVVVTSSHRNLKRSQIAGVRLWVDTNKDRKGPERTISVVTTDVDTDYYVFRAKGWKAQGEPLSCGTSVRVKYKTDLVRLALDDDCFNNREQARVNLQASFRRSESAKLRTDHAPDKHKFYPWVAEG